GKAPPDNGFVVFVDLKPLKALCERQGPTWISSLGVQLASRWAIRFRALYLRTAVDSAIAVFDNALCALSCACAAKVHVREAYHIIAENRLLHIDLETGIDRRTLETYPTPAGGDIKGETLLGAHHAMKHSNEVNVTAAVLDALKSLSIWPR